jgi:hypothetical protein
MLIESTFTAFYAVKSILEIKILSHMAGCSSQEELSEVVWAGIPPPDPSSVAAAAIANSASPTTTSFA